MRKTKTIKKLPYLALAGIAATSSLSAFLAPNNASAATSYQDFSAVPATLSEDWSYTDIYATSSTQVEVVQSSDPSTSTAVGTKGSSLNATLPTTSALGGFGGGESFSALVTGTTSRDANGNPLDILVRLSNIIRPTGSSRSPDHRFAITGSAGSPLNFYYTQMGITYDVEVKWCVNGTYNSSSNDCTAANVSKVNSYVYDIDVNDTSNGLHEHLYVTSSGNTTFYYAKSAGNYLSETGGGLAAATILFTDSYQSSAFTYTEGLSNATLRMHTGGNGGAVDQMFITPSQYVLASNPRKTVDKTSAKVGDYVNYSFTQWIPTNYNYGKTSLFSAHASAYSNINADTRYTALTVEDTLPSDLEIVSTSDIKAPTGFTASTSGNKVTFTAAATNDSIYGKTHTFTIRARVKSSGAGKTLANTAITSDTGRSGKSNHNSNTVNTKIASRYTVTEKWINLDTGEEIAESRVTTYNEGDKVVLATNKTPMYPNEDRDVPEGYVFVGPQNSINGMEITENMVQEYHYRLVKEVAENPNTSDATLGIVGIASIASALLGGIFFISRKRR